MGKNDFANKVNEYKSMFRITEYLKILSPAFSSSFFIKAPIKNPIKFYIIIKGSPKTIRTRKTCPPLCINC